MTRNLKRGLLYDKDSHAPNFGMHKCIPYGVERYGGDKIDTHIQTQECQNRREAATASYISYLITVRCFRRRTKNRPAEKSAGQLFDSYGF